MKEYDDMKKNKKIKDLNSFKDFRLSIKQCSIIVWSVEKYRKENPKVERFKMEEQCFHQIEPFAVVNNGELLKSKILVTF